MACALTGLSICTMFECNAKEKTAQVGMKNGYTQIKEGHDKLWVKK